MKLLLLAAITAGLLCASVALASPKNSIPAKSKTSPFSGAWLLIEKNHQPLSVGMNVVMLCTDNYATYTCYDRVSRKFYYTGGGPYSMDKSNFSLRLEFNTRDSTKVGTTVAYDYVLKGKRLALNAPEGEEVWERMDEPKAANALAGVWRITEREQHGKTSTIQGGPRKTIKILSGTRFQWTAINPETKQFFGCGGGTYTLENGKYTEKIEYFSRDPNRVGASLTFGAHLTGDSWRHQGSSTAGDKVNEVWKREK